MTAVMGALEDGWLNWVDESDREKEGPDVPESPNEAACGR